MTTTYLRDARSAGEACVLVSVIDYFGTATRGARSSSGCGASYASSRRTAWPPPSESTATNLSEEPLEATLDTRAPATVFDTLRGAFCACAGGVRLTALPPHAYAAVRFRLK